MNSKLTHIDKSGSARMVDISGKEATERTAIAKGAVVMLPSTLELISAGSLTKGDVLATAQIAGVMAAKRTAELIPMCHPLALNQVTVEFKIDKSLPGIEITATAKTIGMTGVEMEALTAVSVAALTIYDMAKSAEKTMRIDNIRLVEKRGGRSGIVINE
jgi:cyclic pyranopterin phosphate synthase